MLIVEGTRVDQTMSIGEPEVHDALDEVVRREDKLVVADFAARNIERLRTFHDVAMRERDRGLTLQAEPMRDAR